MIALKQRFRGLIRRFYRLNKMCALSINEKIVETQLMSIITFTVILFLKSQYIAKACYYNALCIFSAISYLSYHNW